MILCFLSLILTGSVGKASWTQGDCLSFQVINKKSIYIYIYSWWQWWPALQCDPLWLMNSCTVYVYDQWKSIRQLIYRVLRRALCVWFYLSSSSFVATDVAEISIYFLMRILRRFCCACVDILYLFIKLNTNIK